MQKEANEYPGQHALYPLCFRPIYKDYLWGGDRIIRRYKRKVPPGIYAESWEVCGRPEGMSEVMNGPLAGITLHELSRQRGVDLLGTKVKGPTFPLLVKLIDAKDTLSVQVHPDDESTRLHGGEPKTEMWYILEADKGACLYCGLKGGTVRPAFERAIGTKKFSTLMNTVPVRPGDAVYVPGGRVHAIGAGCMLLEVQQNSNTTYRLYDWDRFGPDGQPRELHIAQAMQVINWNDSQSVKVIPRKISQSGGNERWEVLTSPYFRLERFVLGERMATGGLGETFHILFVNQGSVGLKSRGFSEKALAGATWLIPATVRQYDIEPDHGRAEVIRIMVP
ncbi:MAG: type I phosphomannose isomerase catalytic subunit [bacterium]